MNYFKKWTILLLIGLCVFQVSCSEDDTTIIPESSYVIQSPVTQRIVDSSGLIARVFHDTVFQVSEGVKETDIHYLSQDGYTMRVYILRVDMNNPSLRLEAGLPYGATTLTGNMQPLPDMAAYYDSVGHHVVGGVNADFFDRTSGVPRGVLVIDGKLLKDTWYNERSATFIGVLKDDRGPFIGTRADFDSMKGQFKYALGAGQLLVDDHKQVADIPVYTEIAPRTGAGLTDEDILYFVVADGRNFYWSNGLTMPQLAALLKACGSEIAVNLDGGGSSTFIIRNPLAPVIQVRNKPSDGTNRPLGAGWLVISTKK